MKTLISAAALSLTLVGTAHAAPISYGDITQGGHFTGATTSNSAWYEENPVVDEHDNGINFWTFSGKAGDRLSVVVNSLDGIFDAAISLFFGQVDDMDLLMGQFDNSADFGILSPVKFVAGTNPWGGTAGLDASLLDILLADSGIFTLAIGGETSPSAYGRYEYAMQVVHSSVPEPATLGLMVGALAGFGLSARRSKAASAAV